MANCIICGTYFKKTIFNNTSMCDECVTPLPEEDSEMELEVELLRNPSGKVKPVMYDDNDVDSFST